ncbi:UNVERIFIED_ORG: hypothetical protein J2W38_007069 [Variovorax paradoxus]|nr:hypothetical protein [Variovorax paradoxus]
MTITIRRTPSGDYEMQQTLLSPVVYFDHWAVRRFSELAGIQDRFVRALHRAGGTLLVSLTNLGEFSLMIDRRQAIEAEQFFDRVLPSLYIADFGADPGFLQEQGRPQRDDWLAVAMCDEWRANGNRLSVNGLITNSVDERGIVEPAVRELKAGVAAAINAIRNDPERVRLARADRTEGANFRDLLQNELLRDFMLDPRSEFSENDAMDFNHSMGSCVSCDIVLLDARWAHKVNAADRRLQAAGATRHRLPRAFSQREIDQFLDALEALPPSDGTLRPVLIRV